MLSTNDRKQRTASDGVTRVYSLWNDAVLLVQAEAFDQLHGKFTALQGITRELMECIDEPPDEYCTCHINPPCSDCVEHSRLRELLAAARAIIYKENDDG